MQKFWEVLIKGIFRYFPVALIIFIIHTHCNTHSSAEKKIVIAMEEGPSTLFPPLANSAYSFRVVEIIHRGILRINKEFNLVLDLAEKFNFTVDQNSIVIDVDLRKNETTCSGRLIDSEMVKQSLEKYKEYGRLKSVRNINILSNSRLEIVSDVNSEIFYDLTLPIFPKEYTDCTGYFRVLEFIPKLRTVLQSRNGDFTIVVRGIPDDITRVLELEKGAIDIVINAIPPNLIEYVRGLRGIKIIESPGINITYIGFNLANRYLSNRNVRKAIAHAIDREKIVREILKDQAVVINSLLPRNLDFYTESFDYEYSPEKARTILDMEGLHPKNGGIRFELVWKTSTIKSSLRVIKAIAQYLENIGIRVKIESREFLTFLYDINQGNFDMYSINIVGVKTPDVLRILAHSKLNPPYGLNRTFFENPQFDMLIEDAIKTFDLKEKKNLYAKAQKILAEQIPYLPLWQIKDVIAFREDKIKIKEISAGGSLTFLTETLDIK